jgi:hypothetical protein
LTLDTLSLHFIPSSPSNCILHAHHQLPERDETTTRYDTISAAPLYCACYCISSARSARLCTALPYRVYSSKTIIHSIFVHLVHLWQYCNDRHPSAGQALQVQVLYILGYSTSSTVYSTVHSFFQAIAGITGRIHGIPRSIPPSRSLATVPTGLQGLQRPTGTSAAAHLQPLHEVTIL